MRPDVLDPCVQGQGSRTKEINLRNAPRSVRLPLCPLLPPMFRTRPWLCTCASVLLLKTTKKEAQQARAPTSKSRQGRQQCRRRLVEDRARCASQLDPDAQTVDGRTPRRATEAPSPRVSPLQCSPESQPSSNAGIRGAARGGSAIPRRRRGAIRPAPTTAVCCRVPGCRGFMETSSGHDASNVAVSADLLPSGCSDRTAFCCSFPGGERGRNPPR